MTLFDEVVGLGFDRSHPTFTRQIRVRDLRPHPRAVLATAPGERAGSSIRRVRTQWDWLELPDPPAHWGGGKNAHLLVGAPRALQQVARHPVPAETSPPHRRLDKTSRKLRG